MNYQAVHHGGEIERNLSRELLPLTDTLPSKAGAGVLIHQLQLIMDSGSQGVLNGQQNWLLWQKENLRQKCKCLQLGETENMGGT